MDYFLTIRSNPSNLTTVTRYWNEAKGMSEFHFDQVKYCGIFKDATVIIDDDEDIDRVIEYLQYWKQRRNNQI